MKIFEKIILIIEEKGPLTIPMICQEVNQRFFLEQEKPLLPSHVKAIITRKNHLFHIKDGNITIQPDKNLVQLIIILDEDDGITYQVNINFSKKNFTYFEWRNKGNLDHNIGYDPRNYGEIDSLKREILDLSIWEWKSAYGKADGITLGKTNWSVKLTTKTKIYRSEGTDCYPENWNKFCESIEKLTGSAFLHKV